MKFIYSSNFNLVVDFNEAIFNNLPDREGLWMPEEIPKLDKSFIYNLDKYSFIEIAKTVLSKYITDIPQNDLYSIIEKSFYFTPKLVKLNNKQFILELFHGPTLAFKDFGAVFMGNLYDYLSKKEINIITATSGDTGGAVANAFYNKRNIKVFILYPKGKVSKLQEKQITTFGKNIFAIEVNGTFDDCQRLIKNTFTDKNISINLVSANSINIARLLPQTLYYFYLYSELLKRGIKEKIIVSVPSGNLGNITSGILAKKMGLPIDKFIAAVNINKTFYDFLQNGNYNPKTSIKTMSNAMDVGNPSNFIRIKYLYPILSEMKKDILSYYYNDKQTIKSIHEVYNKYNYLMDPHTSIGYCAIKQLSEVETDYIYIILSTAHPSKFKDEIQDNLKIKVDIPKRLKDIMNEKSYKISINNNYDEWINTFNKLSSLKGNIILIGMAYCGKTTIGKELSIKTGKKQIDTDDLIIDKYNKSLIEILNEFGNEIFLDIESEIIQTIKEDNIIISTGGSVIYREKTMKFLDKMYGTIYFIDVPLKEIQRRCINLGTRGVVLKDGQTFEDLYNERYPLYKKYSNFKFEEFKI